MGVGMKRKSDWAQKAAERLVADGRGVGMYFKTEDEERDEKRIAAALRRAYKRGLQKGWDDCF